MTQMNPEPCVRCGEPTDHVTLGMCKGYTWADSGYCKELCYLLDEAKVAAEEWNEQNPVGAEVRYWPGDKAGRSMVATTRTEAWVLPCGDAVVSVEGYAGGIALTHVEITDDEVDVWEPDCHAKAMAELLLERNVNGQRKYGKGLDRADLPVRQWITHAQEEALDFAQYLQRLHAEFACIGTALAQIAATSSLEEAHSIAREVIRVRYQEGRSLHKEQ